MACKEVEVRTLMSWVSHVISSEQEPELDAPNPSLAVKGALGWDSQGLTPQIPVPGLTLGLLCCRMSSGGGFKEFGCPVLAVPSPHLDGAALCVTSTGDPAAKHKSCGSPSPTALPLWGADPGNILLSMQAAILHLLPFVSNTWNLKSVALDSSSPLLNGFKNLFLNAQL